MMFIWTANAIQVVKDLWGKQSAGEIARIIGHPSRSAVCGKANRLGLCRPLSDLRVERLLKRKGKEPRKRPEITRVVRPQHPPDITAAAPEMKPCALLDLAETRCRWPLWTDAVPERLYCGAVSTARSTYCRYHMQLSWQRRTAA
jgi:GcrA cell cycle regulator